MNKRKRKKKQKKLTVLKLQAWLHIRLLNALEGIETEVTLDELFGLEDEDEPKNTSQT